MLSRRVNSITRPVGFAVNSVFALILLVLTACQGNPPREEETPAAGPEVKSRPEPDRILPPSQRVHIAIQALQSGDEESARNQLNWALEEKPALKVAKKLLQQLDTDPVELLGEAHFNHTVQAGETISIIARDYLGDPLKFVILARYNSIDNPSQLKLGQQINIPGTKRPAAEPTGMPRKPSESPPPPLTPAESEITNLAAEENMPGFDQAKEESNNPQRSARQLHASGDLAAAIKLLEPIANSPGQPKAVRDQLTGYYIELAESQSDKGRLSSARAVLEKALALDSTSASIINKLVVLEDRIEAQRLYQQGTKLLAAQKLPQAYEAFSRALAYEPGNGNIIAMRDQTRDKLTDSYHRQAMQLFRRHELSKAIEFWDKILALDPQHSLAPGYRARAVELKDKLRKIDQ